MPERRSLASRTSPFIALLVIALACAATAQDESAETLTPPQEIDPQQLSRRIDELAGQQQSGELPGPATQELALLRETQQSLERAAEAVSAADRFAAEARTAPEQGNQIDAYLATPTEELLTKPDRALPIDQLNAELEAARVRLQSERDLRAKVDSDDQHRQTRRSDIPTARSRSTERLDALQAELAAGGNPDEPEAVRTARRWRALAERYLHRAMLRSLDEELRNYDTRRSLLEKRRSYRDRRITIETRNVTDLQEAVNEKKLEQAAAAEQKASEQREMTNHPVVAAIRDDNRRYAARLTRILELKGRDDTARTQEKARLDEWRQAFARSKERIERAGLTNAIGQHLRNQRSRLPNISGLWRQMDNRDERIGELVNEVEDLSLRIDELVDIDEAVERELDSVLDDLPSNGTRFEEIQAAAREALLEQRQYIEDLRSEINEAYLDNLLELQNTQTELYELLVEYDEYIDERILWIRSSDVIASNDVSSAGDAIAWMLDRESWMQIATGMWKDARSNVIVYVPFLMLMLAALVAQPLLRKRVRVIAEKTRRHTSDRLGLTGQAMAVTVLIAALVPLPLVFIGWRLSVAPIGNSLARGLSDGLILATELFFAGALMRVLCRRSGLGEAHFRWKTTTLQLVRRHLRWFIPVVVLLALVSRTTSANDHHHDSLGRLAFMAMMLAFAVLIMRLLAPSSGIVRPFLSRHRGGWLDRLANVWYTLAVLVPVAIGAIAAMGFFYSATQLEQRLVETMWFSLLALVARSTMLRGLFLAQRRLAIEQRRKKLLESGAESTAIDEEQVDVEALSAQTRQLVNGTVFVALIVALSFVWVDMMPALSFLKEVELWTPEPVMTVIEPSGESGGAAPPEQLAQPITLGHIVYSALILLVTIILSKNIPGLLEIVLLQRLPISASGRYAITTIARYLFVMVGLVLAFSAIGIGWSKVQWLVAAMTVGLGFGLQEIFANFVSGLIILFERPIRVGDTVTVGGISGTVSKLRIRATTIVDWDRKELIIPNKEFVTGQIVNWTLSDPILRVVVKVGIAYGSDTKLAGELLLKIAQDDEVVLDDPPSSVDFMEFGDSALIFRLRAFIPSIENLLPVKHRLHTAIDQAFREAGIVIAFPQLDVHMHRGE